MFAEPSSGEKMWRFIRFLIRLPLIGATIGLGLAVLPAFALGVAVELFQPGFCSNVDANLDVVGVVGLILSALTIGSLLTIEKYTNMVIPYPDPIPLKWLLVLLVPLSLGVVGWGAYERFQGEPGTLSQAPIANQAHSKDKP